MSIADRDPNDIIKQAHYMTAGGEGEARSMQADEHICAVCAHAPLCKFMPEDVGQLVVISRCRLYMPHLD